MDGFAVTDQNCKKLEAISSSWSSWTVSSSWSLGCLVPLASLRVMLGVPAVLEEVAARGGLMGALFTLEGEGRAT